MLIWPAKKPGTMEAAKKLVIKYTAGATTKIMLVYGVRIVGFFHHLAKSKYSCNTLAPCLFCKNAFTLLIIPAIRGAKAKSSSACTIFSASP